MHSSAIEDYLKAIYEIQCTDGQVGTTVLAERLNIAPASATGMIKKLAELKLVIHERYQGVRLTKAGQKIALEVLRHHRLVERFLAEALGVPWDRVHEEAHRIEHVLSDDLEERMDEVLGHPTTDPHGAPIPRLDGTIDESASTRLAELQAGQSAVVAEVSDHDSALLRYLGELGLYPQSEIAVMAVAPLDGLMTVRVGKKQHALSHAVANEVLVADVKG
jgi:DtxR family Mn-dependent transcriptional regulator